MASASPQHDSTDTTSGVDPEASNTKPSIDNEKDLDSQHSSAAAADNTSPDTNGNNSGPPTPRLSPARDIAFILCICMAQMLSLAGLAASIAPLQIIGQSFGVTDEAELSWYSAAFSLTVGTFVLPAGQLGDRFGHRNMYIVGFVWYAVWSVIAGVSVYSGSILFAVARGFQGIGPATAVPNALALAGREYPEGKKKNMVFALFGAAAPVGWVVGAAFSSIFAELAWWPWAFFALAIACLGIATLAVVVIPVDEVDKGDRFRDFDYLGCATGVSGLVLVNFSWSQAGLVGWSTVYTYVLLIVGILCLAAFAVVETRFAKRPLVPLKEMTAEVALALAVVSAGWLSFGIWVYYLWRLLELLRGYSALAATAQNTPVAVTGLLAAVATGFLLSHVKVPWVLFISTLFFLTGMILIATVPIGQIYWAQTFVSIVVMPFGMDMSFPSATILVSNGVAKEHQGIAASLVNTAVNWSIALGLGMAGTIARNVGGTGTDAEILKGFRGAWYFGIGLDALAAVIALYFVVRHRKS